MGWRPRSRSSALRPSLPLLFLLLSHKWSSSSCQGRAHLLYHRVDNLPTLLRHHRVGVRSKLAHLPSSCSITSKLMCAGYKLSSSGTREAGGGGRCGTAGLGYDGVNKRALLARGHDVELGSRQWWCEQA
jgi:hypothetical protein